MLAISLLNGIIDITGFNGILAPLQDVSIDLNLPDLLNALGVGNLSLSNLGVDLGSLLNQLGLGNLDLGGLLSALGLSNEGLGTLLGDPTLFARADEVNAAWRFITPILDAWAKTPAPEFPSYAAGTWGPAVQRTRAPRAPPDPGPPPALG